MTVSAPIASAVLAAVFALAGLAKLLDRAGSREAARSFGAPERLSGVVAVGLPLAEVAIAVLLLPAATRAYAAAAALVLLLAFCVAIAVAMARGRAPDCRCFGQLHSRPAGWGTLARNAVLAALAAFVAVAAWNDPSAGAVEWVARLEGGEWLVLVLALTLTAVLVAGGLVILHLLRSYGVLLTRLDRVEARLREAGFELEEPDDIPRLGLEPGSTAPAFWLPSTDGDRLALGDLLAPGRQALLLFTSPSCEPCRLLMPDVARWQREHADELTVALLSDGDPERVRADAAEHGVVNVLVDETLAAYEAYGANGTPSAVLVDADGTIASWLAAGGEWIETLVEEALAGLGNTHGLPIGAELPPLRLATLDGAERGLEELVTRPTVVLFWNPGCGFCRAMRDDLLAWERDRPDGSLDLLVISAGSADDVRGEGLSSNIVLDPDWTASGALGADGTPMAVLVDADRRIGSALATGADAVLELLGARSLSAAR
jgi:methylamine dehydrogenase accessory protein MauD